jgi:hypothetical protein
LDRVRDNLDQAPGSRNWGSELDVDAFEFNFFYPPTLGRVPKTTQSFKTTQKMPKDWWDENALGDIMGESHVAEEHGVVISTSGKRANEIPVICTNT